jgi:hypothetical protein
MNVKKIKIKRLSIIDPRGRGGARYGWGGGHLKPVTKIPPFDRLETPRKKLYLIKAPKLEVEKMLENNLIHCYLFIGCVVE